MNTPPSYVGKRAGGQRLLEIPMFTILTTGKNDPYFLQQPEFSILILSG